jgi:hypothetical protein
MVPINVANTQVKRGDRMANWRFKKRDKVDVRCEVARGPLCATGASLAS